MNEKDTTFDYPKAVAELEKIAVTVEDPKTSLDEIDALMKRSKELVAACREYLRSVRETVEKVNQ
ncbi:MAG: exodeoxyribonuclease VII small subunit [Bacteroidales bacterium]|nr:exodeoxyribonuclease VII small subunit [Bacteroidales bacterium]